MRVRRAAAGLTALVVALAGPVWSVGADAAQHPAGPGGRWPRHSSDGAPGELAAPLTPADRARADRTVRSGEVTYEVAPGLTYEQWDQTDARGPIRAYLLTADLSTPGLRLEYVAMPEVRRRAKLGRMLAYAGAVAGVNGDFFDIDDTGAPLGVGVDGGRTLHGPRKGWTRAFVVSGRSDARIGRASVRARIKGHPRIRITNVNSPYIPVHGIGLYTPAWGDAAGYHVVDGARRADVRQVAVRRGRVVSNTRRLTSGEPVRGRLLVGRGAGAVDLKRLRVGMRVRFAVGVAGDPRVAIGGSERLLRNGEVLATDDTDLHPRTAVGIDRDTGEVLLLVVDGRQEFSRGYTLVELADLLLELGAEDALNLDGGGSSTMVTRHPDDTVSVANSPSDGHQRRIANGLGFTYHP